MSFLQAILGGAAKDRSKSVTPRSHRTTLDHAGFCAPGRIPHYEQYGTCFTRDELLRLIDLYNQSPATSKNRIQLSGQEDERQLSRILDAKLRRANAKAQTQCSKEATTDLCILEQPFIKEQSSHLYHLFKKAAFRPPKPVPWYKNKHTWLNTFNIQDVLKQYEQYDPTFKMLGVVPMDWADALGPSGKPQGYCLEPQVCNVRLSELRAAGKTDFGIVFNLDPHTKSGSHWVSAFCHFEHDDPKFGICYFDSYAMKPPKPVLAFMASIKKQIEEILPEYANDFQVKYNQDRKQYNGSECGMFCILFIVLCNEHPGLSYREVCNLIERDNQASALRDRVFSPSRVKEP